MRGLIRAHKRCCLALGIACFDLSPTNLFRLFDTLLLDEFDSLIVLCDVTGSKLFWDFQVSRSRKKSFFEQVVLDAPYFRQFLSDFVRVKSNISPKGNF